MFFVNNQLISLVKFSLSPIIKAIRWCRAHLLGSYVRVFMRCTLDAFWNALMSWQSGWRTERMAGTLEAKRDMLLYRVDKNTCPRNFLISLSCLSAEAAKNGCAGVAIYIDWCEPRSLIEQYYQLVHFVRCYTDFHLVGQKDISQEVNRENKRVRLTDYTNCLNQIIVPLCDRNNAREFFKKIDIYGIFITVPDTLVTEAKLMKRLHSLLKKRSQSYKIIVLSNVFCFGKTPAVVSEPENSEHYTHLMGATVFDLAAFVHEADLHVSDEGFFDLFALAGKCKVVSKDDVLSLNKLDI